MKLSEIKNGISPEWAQKGYQMPTFDIQAVREKTDLPALYSGIGTEDFSFADSVRYLAYCRKQGLEIHSLEIPGKHEWKVWDTLISDFMDWAMLHAVR